MNFEIKNKIIIWGEDNYNVMGLLRQLKIRNLDVLLLVLGKANGCATKSKYCYEYIETTTIKKGYDYLMSVFVNEQDKPIIITPSDEIIEYIDQHRSKFEKCFEVPGTLKQGFIAKYNDKVKRITSE